MKSFYRVLVFLSMILLSSQFIYPQWVQTNGPGGGDVNCMAVIGANIIAGISAFDPKGVFISSNNGINWRQSNNGLTNMNVSCLSVNGTNVFAGTAGGVFLSTDMGANWLPMGLSSYHVSSFAISGTNIFVSTFTGDIFLSTNNGTIWTQINKGITATQINALTISGNNIFAGTDSGVFLSTNYGSNWSQVNKGWTNNFISCLAIKGTNILAGNIDGIFLSSDNGTNWTSINNGLPQYYVNILTLSVNGDNIFAGSMGYPAFTGGIYRSSDNGANWTQLGFNNYGIHCFAFNGANVFAGASIEESPGYEGGMFYSTDSGTSWTQLGMPTSSTTALSISGDNIFAGSYPGGGIFKSLDNGINWTELNLNYSANTFKINNILASGSNVFAATYHGLYKSTDNGSNWSEISIGFDLNYVSALARSGTSIYAGGAGGVFTSTDNGTSWAKIGSDNVSCLAVSGVNIFAGSYSGVFFTSNNGINWTQVNNGLQGYSQVNTLAITGNYVFACTDSGGVFLSTNNGSKWTRMNNGLININIHSFAINGISLFAGNNNGLFMSKDNGSNWTSVGLNDHKVLSLVANETYLFAGTEAAVWKRPLSDFPLPVELTSFTATSSNNNIKLNWTTATELNNTGFDIERSPNKSDWIKISFVKGNGNSTSPINYSYVDKSVSGAGKYYYRLKQIDNNGTSKYSNVVEAILDAPISFVLNQNYPNPFNPTTTIAYTLKDKGFVKLKVFDIRGQLVKVLVNESKDSGYYETEFNGNGLASGVYIYRIEVIGQGNRSVYSDIKKSVLLK